MIRSVALFGIALLLTTTIGACSSDSIDKGTVVAKKYVPAQLDPSFKCPHFNSSGACDSLPEVNAVTDPAQCQVQIESLDKQRKVWVDVTETQYNRIWVGESWPEPLPTTPAPTTITAATAVTATTTAAATTHP